MTPTTRPGDDGSPLPDRGSEARCGRSNDALQIDLASVKGSTRVVRVVGAARMDTGNELRDRLLNLVDSKTQRLVLDLTGLDFINSMGLGGIIAAHLRLRSAEGEIHLACPKPQIRELLTITRLGQLFPIHES